MNYSAINQRVITKYLGGYSVAKERGYNITTHNRKGEPMFTVRPDGTAYRGNSNMTTLLQAAVVMKGTNRDFLTLMGLEV